ncbi:YdbC family protein [Halobacillus sp. Marseille-P3879]|uniref:YdbC family protein n=1 Tax=Halobacillus sp. Marseille-P3879 TaxID=2045014 RepID=UPI000C7CEE59|nr:YdbC family protein [Halobacillus sp. Marseille-P3879]
MIIKRISCKVKEGYKETFYEYQKQWNPLSKVKGFLGQIGGWSITQPLTACVYSFWENQTDYNIFMEKEHDSIFIDSGQETTCDSIDVSVFHQKLRVPGVEENIGNIVRIAKYIRVAMSKVKEDKLIHFVNMQEEVWNTGMQKSEGILGGTCALSQKQSNEFLVLTGWESKSYHQRYMVEHFPGLLKTAKPKNEVLELTGEQFKVEEAWRVCPKAY